MNFNIYKFTILSLIDYNNTYLDNNKFDISTLNILKFDISIFDNYNLINEDYLKLNNYKDSIYDFYKTNSNKPRDIILINLDNIINNILSIIDLYSN